MHSNSNIALPCFVFVQVILYMHEISTVYYKQFNILEKHQYAVTLVTYIIMPKIKFLYLHINHSKLNGTRITQNLLK